MADGGQAAVVAGGCDARKDEDDGLQRPCGDRRRRAAVDPIGHGLRRRWLRSPRTRSLVRGPHPLPRRARAGNQAEGRRLERPENRSGVGAAASIAPGTASAPSPLLSGRRAQVFRY